MSQPTWEEIRARLESDEGLRERFCVRPEAVLRELGLAFEAGTRAAAVLDELSIADNLEGFGLFYGLLIHLGSKTLQAWLETKMERIANRLSEPGEPDGSGR